jgi:hypothetical protein
MNKGIIISVTVIAVVLFYSCRPLEDSEVIGPGSGYVFYDKGSYSDGWRYLESAPKDAGKLSGDGTPIDFEEFKRLADAFSHGGKNDWRLPTDDEFKRMFNYFLTDPYKHPTVDRGGLQFSDKRIYVTSDGHTFFSATERSNDSNGKEIKKSKLEQEESEVYKSGPQYIAHPIRGF